MQNRESLGYKIARENLIFFIILCIIGIFLTVFLGHKAHKDNVTGLKPWIGIESVELNTAIRNEYGIHSPNGLLISRVFMGSPAGIAGIDKGDIIRRWNGISIINLQQFKKLMQGAVVNESIKLTIDRQDKQLIIYVSLGRRPGTF